MLSGYSKFEAYLKLIQKALKSDNPENYLSKLEELMFYNLDDNLYFNLETIPERDHEIVKELTSHLPLIKTIRKKRLTRLQELINSNADAKTILKQYQKIIYWPRFLKSQQGLITLEENIETLLKSGARGLKKLLELRTDLSNHKKQVQEAYNSYQFPDQIKALYELSGIMPKEPVRAITIIKTLLLKQKEIPSIKEPVIKKLLLTNQKLLCKLIKKQELTINWNELENELQKVYDKAPINIIEELFLNSWVKPKPEIIFDLLNKRGFKIREGLCMIGDIKEAYNRIKSLRDIKILYTLTGIQPEDELLQKAIQYIDQPQELYQELLENFNGLINAMQYFELSKIKPIRKPENALIQQAYNYFESVEAWWIIYEMFKTIPEDKEKQRILKPFIEA